MFQKSNKPLFEHNGPKDSIFVHNIYCIRLYNIQSFANIILEITCTCMFTRELHGDKNLKPSPHRPLNVSIRSLTILAQP